MLTHQAQLVQEADLALALLEAWDAERPVRREVVLTARSTGEVPADLEQQLYRLTTRTNDLMHRAETVRNERAQLTAVQVRQHRQSLVRGEHPAQGG
ncbi:MAG: hypothetical protein GY929_22035 [Actinomycetia bacterium]|nr:hypothetical protein [Actinomycetes bacterium]